MWEVQSKKVFYIFHTSTGVLYWVVIEQQSVLYRAVIEQLGSKE